MSLAVNDIGPKKFPDKRPAYVRRNFYLLCTCLGLLILLSAGVLYWGLLDHRPAVSGTSGIYGEVRRDLAGKLLSAGLKEKAIEQYERYLSEADLIPQRMANMAYTIGKLYMEEGRYEDALSWLYQVEMFDPKTDLAPEVGSKVVACLERLGRFSQAQYSLEARSSLNKENKNEFKGSQAVAQIGKDKITLKELTEAIDAMPDWMRQSMEEPSQREAFLKQYVAEELIYRKAIKLEIDKDPLVRKQAERALRQLMVQKVLEEEIRDKIKISPGDVELYFKANKNRYQEKEAYRIRFIKVKDETQLKAVQEGLSKGEDFSKLAQKYSLDTTTRDKGGEIAEWIEEGLDPTGIGDPTKLWQALATYKKGEITSPVKIDEDFYLFQIISYRPPKMPDMETIVKQVEQDLSKERVEKAYQELIQQALQVSEVQFFPEALHKGTAPKDEKTNPGS